MNDVETVLSLVPLIFHNLNYDANLLNTVDGQKIGFLISNESDALCKGKDRVYSVEGLAPGRQLLYPPKLLDLAESEIRYHVVVDTVLGTSCKVIHVLESCEHSSVLCPDLSSVCIISKACIGVNDQNLVTSHLNC